MRKLISGMKVVAVASVLLVLVNPAHADRCLDAIKTASDLIQRTDARFDAIEQRSKRLRKEAQANKEKYFAAINRFGVDGNYEALAERAIHVADERGRLLLDLASIADDQSAVWKDRVDTLKHVLKACS